ncbi:substrate-binding periplasmic protein [Mangrovicoccus ximenensis]|uniref:substrate-binding periplasmic protein n=1 Tax=Mangrovicoccus ximenensis TaxID=1911570 RepID=UPI000D34C09F|nr:transporter substrate-binding domain-containing protein [Mangrovicoccus ximenensis]
MNRLIAALSCLLLWVLAPAAGAQQRLSVPWVDWPGAYEKDEHGKLTGFYAELARAVAEEAGFELIFVEFASPKAALVAQRTGVTDLLAGPPELPILDTNIASDPVGETAVYLFVPEREGPAPTIEDMRGRRIGVIGETDGADLGHLGGRAGEVVAFTDARDAFGALIMGKIDGVVTAYKMATDLLRQTRLDYRVRTVDPALRSDDLHVMLSPRRAALAPKVNAAIAALSESGKLARLLEHWNIRRPAAVPPVLTVGVTHFPPYQVVRGDGTVTGYGVEALRQLADRAGLRLHFTPISSDDWARGPSGGSYDLLPPLSITESKQEVMDFTIPLQQSPYSIFVRKGEGQGIAGLGDLAGMRVAIAANSWARQHVGPDPPFDMVIAEGGDALLDALLGGQADAGPCAARRSRARPAR